LDLYQKLWFNKNKMAQILSGTRNRLFEEAGNQVIFLRRFLRNIFKTGFEWNELIYQCYIIGCKSLPLVAVTAFVIGLVITIQVDPTLKYYGAQSYTPSMISTAVIREIGPVIIALICAGKIASGIGAELGSMNVTEQIDAMEVSGANSVQYLVVTRILACTLMIPLLTLIGDLIALLGGYVGENMDGNISLVLYYTKSFKYLMFSDLFPAVIKTFFFGFAIGFVGCYKGYNSNGGTEGVGAAANTAVVYASLWVIFLDAVAAQLINIFVYQ
jgi:phospholipid/cholesterol/gamma-HCH transport system permease protein